MSPYRIPGPVDAEFLLTAIPGLLGYMPVPSVTVLGFQGGRLEATMRYDLDLDADLAPRPAMIGALRQVGFIAGQYQPDELLMVINDTRGELDDGRYRRIFGIADRACREVGGIRAGFVVAEFSAGARWHRIWQPGPTPRVLLTPAAGEPDATGNGVLGDPHTSPIAVSEAVRKGRHVLGSRSEMGAMLTPQPHCDDTDCGYAGQPMARQYAEVTAAFDRVRDDETVSDGLRLVNARVDDVADMVNLFVTQATTPQPLTCAVLRELERGLLTPLVRDVAMVLAFSEARAGAELMWRELTRRLVGSGRASAATMLAHLHYVLGEGAYAAVALDVARDADPEWTLAGLLDTGLRNGLPPTWLGEIVGYSYEMAAVLGIVLPPPAIDLDIAG